MLNNDSLDVFVYGFKSLYGGESYKPMRVTVCGEEYIPRATYLAAEKEIEKLHELNWKLEKALMKERGFWLSADGTEWVRYVNGDDYYVPTVVTINIPVGEFIG